MILSSFLVRFFISFLHLVHFSIFQDPAISTKFPEDYLERVKTVHSKGGYGSAGYNYDWKIEEAQKNVLRTHTTAVSARQLYQLAQEVSRQKILGYWDSVCLVYYSHCLPMST